MNWKLFIARRIYSSKSVEKEVSKPAVRIAMAGIAIGLAVMIVSVAVVIGFKGQVREKVVGLTSDIILTSLDDAQLYMTSPIAVSDSLVRAISSVPGVNHVQRYSSRPGMIMTSDNFLGMILKGVGSEYDFSFLSRHLVSGSIPEFTDSVSSNKVVISKSIADKLRLDIGDKVYAYFVDKNVRARRLTVSAVYQTNFSGFDDYFLITDIYTVNRLNNSKPGQVGGVEIDVAGNVSIDSVNEELRSSLFSSSDAYGESYFTRTVTEANPQIFAWLDLLDVNVWVILFLMTGVAGFTMISGLLIIILERTAMIGILKSLGADNTSVRKIFLSFSVFLIGRGMFWGNIIGLSLCVIQYLFHPVSLDPSIYYVSYVPIGFSINAYILLNVFTLVTSVLMLVAPSYLICRIHPARTVRYE